MKLEDLARATNICDLLDEKQVDDIGAKCLQGLNADKVTREPWEAWYKQAMELALQVAKKKTFPWPGAANVKFPLITIAAINWHAKAYPATISGESVVRCRVLGADMQGQKMARSIRVGKYMSYQLLETISWEEQTDKSLLVLPIMGSVFKKTVRDTASRTNCSDMVMPQDLVVDYFTTSMDGAIRATHLFKKSPNEMREHFLSGVYREAKEITQDSPTPLDAAKDAAQHLNEPSTKEVYSLGEQSCWLDLDEDGYAEPYAVTMDENSGYVYRICARYFTQDIQYVQSGKNKGSVFRITPENYYTKYEFIPSPDGGFYGLGLGLLLGPLNESINTAINQIFDGATMATLGGGFLGRGAKMKAGETTFKPQEWKTIDSTGDGIAKNIFPLPIREPSMMLLELVKFLVQYGQQVGGSGDIEMGDIPGQNVKAGTMSIANQNGQKIFKATYKRFWRSLKEEFKKQYRLCQIYPLDPLGSQLFQVNKEDFVPDSSGIIPAADPNIVSDDERRQLATMIAARAQQVPGYDPIQVETRLLESFNVEGIEALYKGPPPNPPPNPEMLKLQLESRKLDIMERGQQQTNQLAVAKLMVEAQKTQAEIMELQARAVMEEQKGDAAQAGQVIAALYAQIEMKQAHHENIMGTIDMIHTLLGGKNSEHIGIDRRAATSLAGGAASTLPPVAQPAGNTAVFHGTTTVPGTGEGGLGA
jgi:chaperonin GroES